MRWREGPDGPPPPRPTCAAGGSGGGGNRPAKAGELARHGDRDQRAALAAFWARARPAAIPAPLRLPADRDHVGGLVVLAALKLAAAAGRPAVVPGGFDQQ